MKRLIFGCGYLGFQAARTWQQAGDQVFAVTRNRDRASDFQNAGLMPIVADVTKPATLSGLPLVDTVLVAIGMDRTAYSDVRMVYVEGLRAILRALPRETGHLVYISSTGVYGQTDGEWVDEDSPTHPTREGGKACLEAEKLLSQSRFANASTVLRLSGIYGKGRVPSLNAVQSRKWDRLNPGGFLNLVHVSDIVTAIERTAVLRPMGETILVSDGNPIERKKYYQLLANEIGIGEIPWPDSAIQLQTKRSSGSKRINNQKMLDTLGFHPAFPQIQMGLKDVLSS